MIMGCDKKLDAFITKKMDISAGREINTDGWVTVKCEG